MKRQQKQAIKSNTNRNLCDYNTHSSTKRVDGWHSLCTAVMLISIKSLVHWYVVVIIADNSSNVWWSLENQFLYLLMTNTVSSIQYDVKTKHRSNFWERKFYFTSANKNLNSLIRLDKEKNVVSWWNSVEFVLIDIELNSTRRLPSICWVINAECEHPDDQNGQILQIQLPFTSQL